MYEEHLKMIATKFGVQTELSRNGTLTTVAVSHLLKSYLNEVCQRVERFLLREALK